MRHNPYNATDIGVTIGDIKKKILKDLEIKSQDDVMELLVDNKHSI
jgi:hypothetical protein